MEYNSPIDGLSEIEKLKKYKLNCNVFSVYDYPEEYTIQELLNKFFEKINECVLISDATFKLAEWLVKEGLEQEVAKKLDLWVTDGTLENIINEKIFNDLNTKVNSNTNGLNGLRNDFNKLNNTFNSIAVYDSDYDTLQLAHDALVNKGGGKLVITKNHVINTRFNWDISKVYIEGNTHILDFSSNTDKMCVRAYSNSSLSHPYFQSVYGMERLRIIGGRQTTKGFLFEGTGNGKEVSHVTLKNVEISSHNIGMEFGHNSYLVKFVDCDIFECSTLAIIASVTKNSGENFQFRGCALYNCEKGFVCSQGLADFFLSDCSLDYFISSSIIDTTNGKFYLNNCHIEFSLDGFNSGVVPFVVKGDSGYISFSNCQFVGERPSDTTLSNIFYTKGGQARIDLINCSMWGMKTTTGWLCGGDGNLNAMNTVLNVVPETDVSINPLVTQCADGSMLNSKFVNTFITNDTETINGFSQTGTNINISYVSEGSYKFNRSIKVVKNYGGGSNAGFAIIAPITRGSTNGIHIVLKKLSGGGTIYMGYNYVSIQNNNYYECGTKGTENINFDTISSDWITYKKFMERAPHSATHVMLLFNMDSGNQNNMLIGEVNINSF